MTEKNQDFEHWRGDAREITVPCDDGEKEPTPVDLTDSSVRWRVFSLDDPSDPPTALISKSTAAGTISFLRVNGPPGELDAIR